MFAVTKGQGSETQKKRHFIARRLSYAARVTGAFALVAAMTALIAASVLAVVWEQQFQGYTRQNMQRVATTTATSLAQKYEIYGSWTTSVLASAYSASELSNGVAIQVVDADNRVVYDDSWDAALTPDSFSTSKEDSVQASIIVHDEKVGTVRIWAYGSSALLTQNDVEFRLNSYKAVLIAALIAVLLATIIGLLFARGLVNPIKRITKTADAIKEGDLTARTNMGGTDEIAQLGMTFDEMAESIEKDRELERRLTTDVAHELRTPLMAMQATIEAMVDGVLPADEVRLATVDSEVVRLGRLVEALLKLSRLENRSVALQKEELDLAELISGLVLSHEMLIEAADLSIQFEADDDVTVLGDSDLLRQATANLISNAVRYTPAGGSITVEVRRGKMMAQIIVRDTGIGIAESDVKHVFSRFWRADAGRNRATGGLGVGLAVVKEVVDRHHGWVNVESVLDKGTTFTIYVPLYAEEARRRSAKGASKSSARGAGKGRSGKQKPVKGK